MALRAVNRDPGRGLGALGILTAPAAHDSDMTIIDSAQKLRVGFSVLQKCRCAAAILAKLRFAIRLRRDKVARQSVPMRLRKRLHQVQE
jgi:hypothetical protein